MAMPSPVSDRITAAWSPDGTGCRAKLVAVGIPATANGRGSSGRAPASILAKRGCRA
jgi:hypothetical protein